MAFVAHSLEKNLNHQAIILHAYLCGHHREYYSALIIPNFDRLRTMLAQSNQSDLLHLSNKQLSIHLDVRRYYCDIIHTMNRNIESNKHIKRFALLEMDVVREHQEQTENKKTMNHQTFEKLIENFYKEIPPGVG
ncbi:MAG: hypothetical protein ACRCWQ_05750 [Bacilli bacterium]